MQYSECNHGRTFVIRLEDGEILHETIEKFAVDNAIDCATIQVVGGVNKNSVLVVGPEAANARPVVKQKLILDNVYEATGTGTIFPDEDGKPLMHLHISCGRGDKSVTGCARDGVIVWQVMEVILLELTDCKAVRKLDRPTGFKLLKP